MTQIYAIIATAIVAVLGVLGYGYKQRRSGRQDQKDSANEDTLKRIEKGRNAVDRDGDPTERVRRNDGHWQ